MIQKSQNITVSAILILLLTSCSDVQLTQQMVIEAEEDRYAAIISSDLEKLSGFLADEFVYNQPTGTVVGKNGYLENVDTGNPAILSADIYELEMQLYDNFAVATGRTELQVDFSGEVQNATLRYLNIWIVRDGRLQLAARQSAFE